MPDNGIESIQDFIKIMNYYKEDMDSKTYKKLIWESNFYLAKLFVASQQFELAENKLRSIYFDMKEIFQHNR